MTPENNSPASSAAPREFMKLGFCDGQVERIEFENSQVALVIKDWRERCVNARFSGVLFCKAFEFGGDISEVSLSYNSTEMDEVKARLLLESDDLAVLSRLHQFNIVHEFTSIVIIFADVSFRCAGDKPKSPVLSDL